MIVWSDIKKYIFIIIAAVVAVALYYFFLYQPPEAQYQTFNFVSGSVVGKDDSGKTITVMASEGQFIPPGIRKTFFIADNAIIQKILSPDENKPNSGAVFEKAGFEDIKIGDEIVMQGEFTTRAEEEKRAFAVSILTDGPEAVHGKQEEFKDVVVPKVSNISSSLYGTIISIGPNTEMVVRALERQIVPEGTEKVVVVPENVVIQVAVSKNETGKDFEFRTIRFFNLSVGQKISVQASSETDVRTQNRIRAEFIIVNYSQ